MNPHPLIPSGVMQEDKYDLDQVWTHNHNAYDKLTKLHYIAFMTIARGHKISDLISVRKKLLPRLLGCCCFVGFLFKYISTGRKLCTGSVLCIKLSQFLFYLNLFIHFLIFISSDYSFNEIHNYNISHVTLQTCTKIGLIAALPTVSYFSVPFFFKTSATPSKKGTFCKWARNIIVYRYLKISILTLSHSQH